MTVKERFAKFVAVGKPDECHVWTGYRSWTGYGRFRYQGKTRNAQRVAWQLAHGPIPIGLCVCHKCDNPPCVNVEHLFLGTPKDNATDKASKGRAQRGDWHPNSKLNDALVAELLSRAKSGPVNMAQIAREIGVDRVTISYVLSRKTWRHVMEAT